MTQDLLYIITCVMMELAPYIHIYLHPSIHPLIQGPWSFMVFLALLSPVRSMASPPRIGATLLGQTKGRWLMVISIQIWVRFHQLLCAITMGELIWSGAPLGVKRPCNKKYKGNEGRMAPCK